MNEMEVSELIWHNGNISPKEKIFPLFDFNFLLSNYFLEYFFTAGTEILFFNETLLYFHSLLNDFHIDSVLFADEAGETFKNETRRLLIRNKCYKTTRCYILFSRSFETGILNEYILLVADNKLFGIEKIIKKTFVCSRFLKPLNEVMNLSPLKSEFKKIIRSEINNEHVDDCIILNQNHFITETYLGNLFLIEQGVVYTPSLSSGCTPLLLRNIVISLFRQLNFQVSEKDDLQVENLFNADEVVVAGETGIYSLRGIEYKRYFDNIRKTLISKIIEQQRD